MTVEPCGWESWRRRRHHLRAVLAWRKLRSHLLGLHVARVMWAVSGRAMPEWGLRSHWHSWGPVLRTWLWMRSHLGSWWEVLLVAGVHSQVRTGSYSSACLLGYWGFLLGNLSRCLFRDPEFS